MDAAGFYTTKHWPNLLQLVRTLSSSPESGLGPSTANNAQLGPSVGDDTPGIHRLGPSVGDDQCDARLKDIIASIGTTVYGLPLYQFRYRGQTEVYEGVMAQDVLNVMPSAVCCAADGTYRVNLRQLGVELRRVS